MHSLKIKILCFIFLLGTFRLLANHPVLADSAGIYPPSREKTAPELKFDQVATLFSGVHLQWNLVFATSTVGTAKNLYVAQEDYDLLQTLPTTEDQLDELLRTRNSGKKLPLLLNNSSYFSQMNFHGYNLFLSSLRETEHGLLGNMVFSVLTPEKQVLNFVRRDIPITGLQTELCGLQMMLEGETNTDDPEFPLTIKGSMDLDSASYVTFNCDGFENFQLLCEYRFPQNLLKPVEPGRTSVRAMFRITSTELGSFIGSVSIDPFEVKGLDDVRFNIQEAVVDYSTAENYSTMSDAISPDWPEAVKNKYEDATWRGFYMKQLSISLPEGLANTSGGRITISVEDLLADHGSGVSCKFTADPNVSGNISGWGISLNNVLLELVANSIKHFKLEGDINIPIMEGNATYEAMFTYPNNQPGAKAEISFTLGLDGVYHIPFINNSNLTLDNGSSAGISYINGKFQPQADLNGSIAVSITNPAITLPTLEFQGFKINDQTMPAYAAGPGQTTGGLDRISVEAFGFAGINFPLGGNGTGLRYPVGSQWNNDVWAVNENKFAGPNGSGPGYEYDAMYDDGEVAGQNQKLSGFPITIKNIGLNKAQDGNVSCYKLDFSIGVNFAKGVNAFNADGSFSIWGGLDFNKILSSTPWKALSYRKTNVESIYIDADLGKIAIAGGVRLIDNDPVYGSGFKGAIAMHVKLPTANIMVNAVGQFGNTPSTGGAEGYRYFFVDAEAGFGSGLPLGSTGLSIYGFMGGFFYNMVRNGADPNVVIGGMKVSQMPANNPPNVSGNLLDPGVSLSGTVYVPQNNNTSFKAGLIFGLAVPQTLLADATFGMDINTSSGFAVQRVYFLGGAYFMNKGLADRKNAAGSLQLKLEMDLVNNKLLGNFGFSITAPTGAPPDLAMVRGSYNTNLTTVNIYFKFNGKKEYFFYAGTPDEPMKINFQLTSAIKLSNINGYFMTGTEIPGVPTLAQVFAKEGFNLPSELMGVASKPFLMGDNSIAFGARLSVPNKEYSFLMFRASIKAFAGFDASLTHYDQNVTCGSNGSFGMNNWYIQGQAYGAFQGNLKMKINILFYSGTVNIASLEAGAALQAKLPNPSWMMGFIYGRYSVLGGRIKGKFSFKVEMGEKCSDLPEYDPLSNIPLIQDVFPQNNANTEIFDSPMATFFVPMGQTINVELTKDNGSTETKLYQCYINTAQTWIKKKGTNITVPYDIIYKDSFNTAVFQVKNLLDANTNYDFKIRVGWKEIKGSQVITSSTFEEKTITFRTGDKPRRIVTEAVGYMAPGDKQRYWNKNYAKPMLEFKQQGWDYLFPLSRAVAFKTKDPTVASAFQGQGWARQNVGDSIKLSKNVALKYLARLKNIKTNEITDVAINEHPLPPSGPAMIPQVIWINVLGFSFPIITLVPNNITGTKVRFDGLNNLNLTKEGIYSIEIIRTPAETVQMPVSTVLVENTQTFTYNDTLEVGTIETSSMHISATGNFWKSLQAQLGDDVLYKDYYFGVSKYDHIKDKFNAMTFSVGSAGNFGNDFGYPDEQLFAFKVGYGTSDYYYGVINPTEPLDYYDQMVFNANIVQRSDGTYGNPIRDYLGGTRSPIEFVDLVGTRANSYVKDMRKVLAKNDAKATTLRNELSVREVDLQGVSIPIELYFPINDKDQLYSDQTGVLMVNDNPSFWYSFKTKKLNDKASGTRLSFQQYYDFTKKVTSDYLTVNGWANKFYYNTKVSDKLTQAEINSKQMAGWGPGKYPANYSVPNGPSSPGEVVMWVQNSEARINRTKLAFYTYQANCLELLSKALIISKTHLNVYRLMRNYYTSISDVDIYTELQVIQDAFGQNRYNLLKQKQIGLRLLYSPANTYPEYYYSKGTQLSNTIQRPYVYDYYPYPYSIFTQF